MLPQMLYAFVLSSIGKGEFFWTWHGQWWLATILSLTFCHSPKPGVSQKVPVTMAYYFTVVLSRSEAWIWLCFSDTNQSKSANNLQTFDQLLWNGPLLHNIEMSRSAIFDFEICLQSPQIPQNLSKSLNKAQNLLASLSFNTWFVSTKCQIIRRLHTWNCQIKTSSQANFSDFPAVRGKGSWGSLFWKHVL